MEPPLEQETLQGIVLTFHVPVLIVDTELVHVMSHILVVVDVVQVVFVLEPVAAAAAVEDAVMVDAVSAVVVVVVLLLLLLLVVVE